MSKADRISRNRNTEKIRKAFQEGKHLESDKFIALTLAPKDEQLRKEVLNHPDLLELKRLELKLKRSIKHELADETQ